MMEYIIIAGIVGFTVIVIWMAHYKHVERMEDKKIELKVKTVESEVKVRDDTLANNALVNRLMDLLNIDDWRWSHKHDECRAELFTSVEALLNAVGESDQDPRRRRRSSI